MIFLGFALLNDRNYVGVPVVIAALVIPACWAGCWMGFCLGNRGFSTLASSPSEILTQTEDQWQTGSFRRSRCPTG
jgi:hypothetical protein